MPYNAQTNRWELPAGISRQNANTEFSKLFGRGTRSESELTQFIQAVGNPGVLAEPGLGPVSDMAMAMRDQINARSDLRPSTGGNLGTDLGKENKGFDPSALGKYLQDYLKPY